MARADAPEDLIGASREPLEVEVRCARCAVEARVRVPWVTIDPRVRRGAEAGWDGVALATIFTCAGCGAVDAYEVCEESYQRLILEKDSGAGSRVIAGITKLWDGTVARRPAEALVILRALTETRPNSAEAWRRLGNFCERYELRDESLAAWRKAVEIDADEFEAAYSVAAELFASTTEEISQETARYLRLAIQRFANTRACPPERRADFAEALAEHLFDLADAADGPIVLLASWAGSESKSEAFVNVSSAELQRLVRRDTLHRFLAREDLFALDVVESRQSEDRTNLELLLGASDENEARAIAQYLREAAAPKAPVRAAPRPGRNDPCPCGSSKKYKKCHGR